MKLGLNYFCINCNETIKPTSRSNFCNKKCKANYRNRITVMGNRKDIDISLLDDNNFSYYDNDRYLKKNKYIHDKIDSGSYHLKVLKGDDIVSMNLKDFVIGTNNTPTNLSKNWGKKIPALLDTKNYAMSRSEILESLNMPSVQEVKQYCDRLVKGKIILQDYNPDRTPKYLYTTQKALAKASKS